MRSTAFILLALFASVGCVPKHADAPPIGVTGPVTDFGDYTKSEVELVSAALAKLRFPVAPGTMARLLPCPLPAVPVEFSDWWPDREGKGRMGGNIVEYWLNREFVLRVASAYYDRGEDKFTMEEWAVMLRREERDRYRRAIYPGAAFPVESK
jgi:hypothetical protein